MKRSSIIALLAIPVALAFSSCHWAKEKTEETANKAGETVARTGSEVVDGAKKGIEKAFSNEIVVSPELKEKGLQIGKTSTKSSANGTDDILQAYLIFNGAINQKITVKVFTGDGTEYGRTSMDVSGAKGEAKYVDFTFDPRTNIDGRGKITFE